MNTIPAPTKALLQRLDEGYQGIETTDIDAAKAIWKALLDDYIEEQEMEATR